VTTGRLGLLLVLGGVAALASASGARAQEPAPPAPPPAAQEPAPSLQPQPQKKSPKHSHDLRILGTVFTPEGYSFPGAQVRIHRAAEKKFRWVDVTNSLGEFAFWVPLGAQYELVVQARGFEEQSRRIDADSGERFLRLSLRMQRAPEGKKK